jgi:hypothetical protein
VSRRARGGSAHLEFALILPVLLTIIFGIMEFGWLFFQRTAVQEAMRQGCRQGATLDPASDDIDAEVEALTLTALGGLGVRCDDGACVVRTTLEGSHPTQRLRCVADVAYRPLVRLVPVPAQLSAGYVYYLEVQ